MAASDVFGLVMRPRRVRAVGSRALSAVAQQEWLDRPSYRLEHVLTIVFASFGGSRERVSNALHGTWLGHPLHPALTTLPVGAITTTVALDGAATLSRIRGATPAHASGMRDASRLTLGIGILGSLGAAATGLTDWQHTQEHSRRVEIGRAHV